MKIGSTTNPRNRKIIKLLLLVMWWFLVLYNFHRYIFKFNSEATSPTYTDTPFVWKFGKYVIAAGILFCLYLKIPFGKGNKKIIPLILIGLIMSIFIFFNFLYFGDINFDEIEYLLYLIMLIPFTFARYDISYYGINIPKLLKLTLYILSLFNLIVIFNYFARGVLPALAYEGGLVRFGGYWDDPNGFGLVSVYFLFYFLNRRRLFCVILSLLNIILTFSLSCYVLLIFALIFYFICVRKKIILVAFSFIILTLVVVFFYDQLFSLYELKQDSIKDHLNSNYTLNFISGRFVPFQFSENWYVSFFLNYFPFSIFIIIGLVSYILNFTIKFWKTEKTLIFFFLLWILGLNFFPLFYIFPLNLMFFIVLINSFKKHYQLTDVKSA